MVFRTLFSFETVHLYVELFLLGKRQIFYVIVCWLKNGCCLK